MKASLPLGVHRQRIKQCSEELNLLEQMSMGLLYYWKDYRDNTAGGPIFKLNQKTPKLHEVAPGDSAWAIARN